MNALPEQVFARIVALRRDIHKHPELSWKEERTASCLEAYLRELGLEPRRMGGTGVVADVPGRQAGPMVALRADTDGLPIVERTGLPFASVHEGVMHACGHDAHSSMVMGAAELLVKSPPPLPVRLIWQPAEEEGDGAERLIAEGVLEGVRMIFGGHVDRRYDAGVIVVTEGPVNASTDTFRITIEGQSGHGARPHEAVDTVVVGSLLVMALQTLVSREVNPAHPSVVTVGSFHAGSASNVIAGQAHLEGTIRTQEESVRAALREGILRICRAVGDLHDARVLAVVEPGVPPVVNPPAATAVARRAAIDIVGDSNVLPMLTANMGGEDFAYYLHQIPGCYIRFGSQVPGLEGFPAHSDRFDVDENSLGTAALYYDRVARLAGEHLLAEGGS